MAVDYQAKWVDDGVTFPFTDPYNLGDVGQDEARADIPSAKPQRVHGEYQEDGFLDGRPLTFGGRLLADTAQELRDRWDILTGALVPGREGKFFKHGDRYIVGRIISHQRPVDEGFPFAIDWSVALRCSDPFWYEDATQSATLAVGSNVLTPGGNFPPAPIFTLVVSSPGVVTVSGSDCLFTLTTTTAGEYRVDTTRGSIEKKNGSAWDDVTEVFAGYWYEHGMTTASETITVSVSGGAAITNASKVEWQRRFTSA